jgi:hypothetical protein
MPFFCSYGKRTGVIDGFSGIEFPYIKKFDSLSFKDYLISPDIDKRALISQEKMFTFKLIEKVENSG